MWACIYFVWRYTVDHPSLSGSVHRYGVFVAGTVRFQYRHTSVHLLHAHHGAQVKLTFLSSELTFLSSELTFLSSELTFLSSELTFLSSELTFLSSESQGQPV
jgi:hypothetical protein